MKTRTRKSSARRTTVPRRSSSRSFAGMSLRLDAASALLRSSRRK